VRESGSYYLKHYVQEESDVKQLFINLTIESCGRQLDIRIDSNQKIGESLAVLRQSKKIPDGLTPDYFRSRVNQKLVSAHKTFNDEQIYDGDILIAIE